jgi:ketosteroid isomerase-like protein
MKNEPKGGIVESENKPPEEPHPDEPRGNGKSASEGDEQDEGKVGEPHPDEPNEPDKGSSEQAVAQENLEEHDLPLDAYHRAGRDLTNGNPALYKALYSHQDDVTNANPFGPPVRGWSEVSATLDRAAGNYRDGEVVGFENVSTVIGLDLAYTVEFESYRARVGGAADLVPVSLRVTTIFRREEGVWKVLHRHADPITSKRPAASVIQTD